MSDSWDDDSETWKTTTEYVNYSEAERYNSMGVEYMKDSKRNPRNRDMAIYCFKKAAELGSENAKHNLRELSHQLY